MSNNQKEKIIFSNNLKRLVANSNLPQREIAKRIKVSPQTFNTWMQGIAIPRMSKIQLLADFFAIEKSDLIEEKSNIVSENRDISIMVDDLMNNLNSTQSLMFKGEPMDETTKELVRVQFADLGENKGLYHTLEIDNLTYHCIHINNNLSSNEQRYTLAHELGHYILHQGSNLHFLRRVTNTPLSRQEIEADLFASYFMVSDEEIKEINNLTYISESYKLDYRICEKRLEYLN